MSRSIWIAGLLTLHGRSYAMLMEQQTTSLLLLSLSRRSSVAQPLMQWWYEYLSTQSSQNLTQLSAEEAAHAVAAATNVVEEASIWLCLCAHVQPNNLHTNGMLTYTQTWNKNNSSITGLVGNYHAESASVKKENVRFLFQLCCVASHTGKNPPIQHLRCK